MQRLFRQMSSRERRLAVLTALVLVAGVGALVLKGALARLDTLDATIESFEQELVYLSQLAEQSAPVNEVFANVAAEHSSEWTQEEIHDRLRREITRLQARDVPPRGQTVAAGAPMLVNIRSMPGGTLVDSGGGYRQYHVQFRTEPTPIRDLVTFMARLQQSQQALRLEKVDLTRQPESPLVTATIGVTRTVIDDEGGAQPSTASSNGLKNGSFEEWDDAASVFPDWEIDGARAIPAQYLATDGVVSMEAVAARPDARVFQRTPCMAGNVYDLRVDVAAWGPALLGVANDTDGELFDGAVSIEGDGQYYRYHVRFAAPNDAGVDVPLCVPCIVIEEEGTRVHVDNAVLTEAEE
ncbi:MAG: type II secretion system protein M [bacterium]|nr:type II secretion system protein M [bacterium]